MRKGTVVAAIKTFSKNLRTQRIKRLMSQEKLAELVGCHVNHIGRIERAQADPSLSMMVKISDALSIPLRELIP